MELKLLVNDKTGIVHRLNLIKNDNGAPRIYSYGSEMVDLNKLGHIFCPNSYAGGAGFTDEQAKKSSVGELIERYCCSVYDEKNIIYGCYNELYKQYNMVKPELFSLYSNQQYKEDGFPFTKFDKDSYLGWTYGKCMLTGKMTLIPACLCYLPYIYRKEDEVVIAPSISTGAAAGETIENAIISGIYECIERDAFTIMWLNQMNVKKIIFAPDKTDFLNTQFKKYFETEGYAYHVYDITNDLGVTTIYTIVEILTDDRKIYVIGAASHLNPVTAVLKSLKEAVQGKAYVINEIIKEPSWQPRLDFKNVNDFSVSAKLYTIYPVLQKYLLSVEERVVEEIPAETFENIQVVDELKTLLKICADKCLDVYCVNLTTCDSIECGIYVIKAIIPQLQPLHGDHNYPFLGGERLYRVPLKLGYLSKPNTEEYFRNVKPHPFP